MTGTSRETKEYFEKMLQDNWCETPIHFVGQEFDQDGTHRWINPFYSPTFSENRGLAGRVSNFGTLYVACWAENDLEAMALSDKVVEFIGANASAPYITSTYSIEDHGWHKANKVFVTVAFTVETIGGTC